MGRFIAVVAIIMLHTQPFRLVPPEKDDAYRLLDVLITNLARFAVPFFFVISGYFWGHGIRNREDFVSFSIMKIRRIFLIFIFWTLVYLIPYSQLKLNIGFEDYIVLIREHINDLYRQPYTDLLMRGSKLHLWYLVALMCSMIISTFFVKLKQEKPLFILAVGLYIVGVLSKSYQDTPIGMDIGFNTLYGPFFGTLFFVSGYFLSNLKITKAWLKYGIIIFLFGTLMHFIEMIVLWRVFENLPQHDYVFGTYWMGIGFSIIMLVDSPKLQENVFSKVGRLSLGIYAVHYIFVDLFSRFDQTHHSAFWEIGYVMIVLILAILVTYLLSLNRFTHEFVS